MNCVTGIRLIAAIVLGAIMSLPAAAAVTWNKVYSGFSQPVEITSARDGSGRLFVVQQNGHIKVIKNGVTLATSFLDLTGVTTSSGERGLLGLAFHPQYATNRHVYVNYTRSSDGATVIARYTAATAASDVVDTATAQVLLVIAQPYDNHNGGAIKFGADGFLYIGTGDGGSGNDPEGRAQDKTTLLGKMLRIDVNQALPYVIPPGNPFPTGVGGRAEIFAIGLRNPWRISFDRATGDLWIGDVGQGAVEEIDMFPAGTGAGANLGWRVLEGNSCTGNSGPITCTDPTLTAPVITYTHSVGCSVTGGFVYRGSSVPSLAGQYVYGDFCSGRLWAAQKIGAIWTPTQLADTTYGISGFGEDDAGELYFADYNTGDLYKFADTAPPASPILTLTSASLNFGSVNVGVDSLPQTVTVSNSGGGSLTLLSLTSGRGGASNAEFPRSGTCAVATVLGSGQTCTLTFTFRPNTTGNRIGEFSLATSAGTRFVVLSGTGINPAPTPVLSASVATLAFGSVLLGSSSATQTITLANLGGGTLTLTSLTPGGANPGDFSRTGTCAAGGNLAAGQNCSVIYQFTPTTVGARTGSLAIASNGGSVTLNLTGTGSAAPTGPTLTPSATVQAFGNVMVNTQSAPQTLTLTNTGTGTLTIASLTAGGTNPGEFARTGTCAVGTNLTAGASCTIIHRFTPAAPGSRSATLTVASNGGGVTINLTGSGIGGTAGPMLSPAATTLSFGSVPLNSTSAPQTATLTNIGTATVLISSMTVLGANPGNFRRTGTCVPGVALLAGQSCTITITFRPTAAGVRSASLTVSSNGGSATISATGNGGL